MHVPLQQQQQQLHLKLNFSSCCALRLRTTCHLWPSQKHPTPSLTHCLPDCCSWLRTWRLVSALLCWPFVSHFACDPRALLWLPRRVAYLFMLCVIWFYSPLSFFSSSLLFLYLDFASLIERATHAASASADLSDPLELFKLLLI